MKLETLLYAVAAAAAGLAIQMCDGEYRHNSAGNAAIAILTQSIAATGIAVMGPARLKQYRVPRFAALGTFAGLFGLQFTFLLFNRPDSAARSYLLMPAPFYRFSIFVAALGAATVFTIRMRSALVRGVEPALNAHVGLAASMLGIAFTAFNCMTATHQPGSAATPHIDVFVFQQQGARVLLHGKNPYEIADYPDIYQSGLIDPDTGQQRQQVYGPGLSNGRTLRFGFPYLPASLYLTTLGYAIAGDYRVIQVLAMVLAALLLTRMQAGSFTRRVTPPLHHGPSPILSAILLLSTPRIFFVLISGWTEPLLVMWMAWVVLCASRRSCWLPVALGMLLATKQYMLLALPVTFLLIPPGNAFTLRWIKLLAAAGAVALVVTLPLALWNWRSFWFSAFTVQRYAPFRWDALSYLTWHAFGNGPPSELSRVAWPFAVTTGAIAFSVWRGGRTPAGFAGATAFILLVFIAFNKQAFANYYFFVIGALCCAAAAPSEPVTVTAARPQ